MRKVKTLLIYPDHQFECESIAIQQVTWHLLCDYEGVSVEGVEGGDGRGCQRQNKGDTETLSVFSFISSRPAFIHPFTQVLNKLGELITVNQFWISIFKIFSWIFLFVFFFFNIPNYELAWCRAITTPGATEAVIPKGHPKSESRLKSDVKMIKSFQWLNSLQ